MNRAFRLLALAVLSPAFGQEEQTFTFGTTVVSTTGFHGQIYHLKEDTAWLPRFSRMTPAGSIYTNSLNVQPQSFEVGFPGITGRFEWFAIDYNGRFWIEQEGRYRFRLLSDDGARLSIDGKELIDNDGIHGPAALFGSAVLSRGIHRIRVSYFQGPRVSVALVLSVSGAGSDWRIFDTQAFLPPKDSADWVDGKISGVKHSSSFDNP